MTTMLVITFSVSLISLHGSDHEVYAQQGGSATSGLAAGGSVTTGGITISGSCNQCTVTNAPQATGGAAASGAAISRNAAGPAVTNISTLVDKGNALADLGMYTQAIQYYDKALAVDPNFKQALDGKQDALSKMGSHNN